MDWSVTFGEPLVEFLLFDFLFKHLLDVLIGRINLDSFPEFLYDLLRLKFFAVCLCFPIVSLEKLGKKCSP